ncbi:MAG: DMT family transporter [Alphaproteobacteria bacterium]|nr:DMT family transporter [Alphaproteobacteria bacterium]
MTTSVAVAQNRPLPAIACMVAAVTVFSLLNAGIKLTGSTIPVLQQMFFRNAGAFLPILVVLIATGGMAQLRTRRLGDHGKRAGIGLVSQFCFFYAFAHLPLADVVATGFAAPLFLTALAPFLLGESVGWRRWSAVAVGFAGVLLLLQPGQGGGDYLSGAGYAGPILLGGTVLYALVMVMLRQLGSTEASVTIVFYFSATATVGLGLALPLVWVTPADWREWAILIGLGVFGGIGQILMTQAFRLAPASIVAPFDYSQILWAVLLGHFIWSEWPTALGWSGVGLVIASGLYILHREAVRGAVRPPQIREPTKT